MGMTFDPDVLSGVLQALDDVAAPGSRSEQILRGETGEFLRACFSYTPQATAANIRKRSIYRFEEKYGIRGAGDLKLTYNNGERGGPAVADNVWLRSGGKFHIMVGPGRWGSRTAPRGAHWPDWLWAQYQALETQSPAERQRLQREWIDKALKSRGLARQSWLQAADSLGIEIPGVSGGELRGVRASDGRAYTNGRGQDQSTREALRIELRNTMPALAGGGLDGEDIQARAAATRASAFDHALRAGVFADIAAIRARYPALLVS